MKTEQKRGSLHPWQFVEDAPTVEGNLVKETLFSLGNGYLGLRGAHEENFEALAGNTLDETFINGFYESSPLEYPEGSYGLAKDHQFMLNVPNAKGIRFSLDDENFDVFSGTIIHYDRSVDFRDGILSRNVEWSSRRGKRVSVSTQRIVSFPRKNLFAIQYEIRSINFSGTITLRSALDGRTKNVEQDDEPRYAAAVASVPGLSLQLLTVEQTQDFSALVHCTKNSGFELVSAVQNDLVCQNGLEVKREQMSAGSRLDQVYSIDVKEGDVVTLTKYGVYFTSKENPAPELLLLAKSALNHAQKTGFAALCAEQKSFLADFWKYADCEIVGDDSLNQGVHFNQFHLLQSVGRDGLTSIAAKGLTGEGYGGHYFWDAEIYALPFYVYTRPEIARKMLEYRYHTLPQARNRAREMSHPQGALYAWRTINGDECSAYFPGGTAQYHINADIAYAIKQYYETTGDEEFIVKYGAEMVMDTARIWMGIGTYVARKNNQFCINEVTGPDEYTAMVNNNFYTNAMAQMHLRFAAHLAAQLKASHPADYLRVATVIGLSEDEPQQWTQAAKAMYIPYDKELGIHPQDDTFLDKAKWDFSNMPKGGPYDLPLHHHYLVIYRHQVCKQGDVVLADFLLGDRFTLADKKRDYDYYEPITTHDSSLSRCTYGIIAAEIGYTDRAYHYFSHTVRGDLDNLHGNTSYGVHIACMAGSWSALVNGFAGMRAYDGKLQFAPQLPEQWERYSFNLYFQSQRIKVEVDRKAATYRLLEGNGLQFSHCGRAMQLSKANPSSTVPLVAESSVVIPLEQPVIRRQKVDA